MNFVIFSKHVSNNKLSIMIQIALFFAIANFYLAKSYWLTL